MTATTVLVATAYVVFSVVIFARAVSNDGEGEGEGEQREAVFARDGETADEAHSRIENCVSSEFGLCPPYER